MAGIILLLSTVASARNYELELIVFERTSVSSEIEEQWPLGSNQGLVHQETLRELASRSIEFPIEFPLLDFLTSMIPANKSFD